jgi:ribonuclease P protein component
VKRRLRAIAREILPVIPGGTDVVVRALPTASQADWNKLSTELKSALDKALGRSNQQ